MNPLQLALFGMLERLRGNVPIIGTNAQGNPFKKRATPGKAKSGKTRSGAKHIVGKKFQPRKVTTVISKLGLPYHPTPALYRRLHLGAKKVGT